MVEDNIPLDDHNKWADFWRNNIGVNVISADTKNKTTRTPWAEYQEKPISQELHNKWKNESTFSKGMTTRLRTCLWSGLRRNMTVEQTPLRRFWTNDVWLT